VVVRLLITGGGGLMGSKVAEVAAMQGHVVFFGYHREHHESGHAAHGKGIKLDLMDHTSIVEAIRSSRPEVVIHTAALTDVDRCEIDKDTAYRVNVLGTRVLCEAARERGAFTIYTSTDYVFDGTRGMYSEEDKANPINYYGYSKLQGEAYCDAIARTCVIFGARPASGKVNFALWLIDRLTEGESVKVVTDQYVTPTLNTNLARMVLELAARRLKGIYHLSGATRISRYDFACELARAFDLEEKLITPSKMADMKWAARRPADSSLNTSKAIRCLDEKPMAIREALRTLKAEID
jgi:dTDP-4-dehydrorhamnose reductase